MSGNGAIAAIDFYATADVIQESDPALGVREIREVRLRVRLPTLQLLEGLANLVSLMSQFEETFQTAARENAEGIIAQLNRLRAMNAHK